MPDKSLKPKSSTTDLMPRDFVFATSAFPLGVKKITKQGEYHYHVHEGYSELVVISRGHTTHLIGGQEYPVRQGDVFIIPEGISHAYANIKDIQINNVLFDQKELKMPLFDLGDCPGFQLFFGGALQPDGKGCAGNPLHLMPSALSDAMTLIDSLENVLEHRRPGFQFAAMSIFEHLIFFLTSESADAGKAAARIAASNPLEKLTRYMEKNLSSSISVAEMCRYSNMSRANLFRYFKTYFHTTPLKYLQNIRIQHAAGLLENSALSISEIAAASGFADSAYFARQFQALTGTTPSRFRKKKI